jgi:sterol desaturase/sphingolipid hydroxylase (fatty acid hydroxylase superfamily)
VGAALLRWLWSNRVELVLAGVALAVIEAIVLTRRRAGLWTLKESLSNIFILWIGQGSRMLTFVWRFGVFAAAHRLSPLRIRTTLVSVVVCYVALDFIYYWKHRWLHETAFGWSMHGVHHSSPELNLTTSIRSSWVQRLLDDFFYLPLVLLGFDPLLVLITADVNLFSQFWIHTRILGRLGPLEWLLNTPSSHRVHHAHARRLANRNFGSTFIVWDRLFGTYLGEPAGEPAFGIEEGFVGHDPLRIQLAGHVRYFRALWSPSGRREVKQQRKEGEQRPEGEPGAGE